MMVVWLNMSMGQNPPKFDDVISEQALKGITECFWTEIVDICV